MINKTISSYTQTYNCIAQDFPFVECIISLLGFSDEVVVVDAYSNDGTYEKLENWSKEDSRIKLYKGEINSKGVSTLTESPKAVARSYCTGDWCWQMDIDEIVHEKDYDKIRSMVNKLDQSLPEDIDIVCLPIVEYWGPKGKVRVDINPWKWRLSRNKSHITHGVRKELRKLDEEGNLISSGGSDADDYIHKDSFEQLPIATFMTNEIEMARRDALLNNNCEKYQAIINSIVENMPTLHHYSWYSIKRKINDYKLLWGKHWNELFGENADDTPENNIMFDKPWSEVTENDMVELATLYEKELGGWIFHKPVDWSNKTTWIQKQWAHPAIMSNWNSNKEI